MKYILLIVILYQSLFAHTTTVSLQLSWLHQFQFAGYYMAIEKGYYKNAGIDLVIREYSKENIKQKSDFYISRSNILIDKINGKDIIALGASFQHSPLVLLALKSSNINKPQDLIGKKIMITDDAATSAAIMAMMRSKKLEITKIKLLPHTFHLQDLIDKKTDVMASYISNEPIRLTKQNIAYTILDPKDYGFDFYDDILTTSLKYEKEHPQLTKDFYEATLKGWEYAYNHIEESAKVIFLKYNHQKKTLDKLIKEGEVLKTLAYDKEGKIGTLDPIKLSEMASVFKIMGFVERDFIPKDSIYKYNSPHKIVIPVDNHLYYIATLITLLMLLSGIYYIKDQKRKKFVTSLVENMGEGVYSVNSHGKCTWVNKKALQMLGYSKKEILDELHGLFHHHKITGEEYNEEECPVIRTIHDGQSRESEEYFIKKDGTFFPVALTVSPTEDGGVIAVFKDISSLKKIEDELKEKNVMLEKLSKLDSLTQIPNRRYFDEHFALKCKETKRENQSLIIMMIDIDFFKQYNDHYGHVMGDEALFKVATTLQNRLKRPSDMIARYGGEEFVIILKDMDRSHTMRFANSLISEIEKLHITHEFSYISQYVTISLGIAYKRSHEQTQQEILLKKADEALYKAKGQGRKQAVMYEE